MALAPVEPYEDVLPPPAVLITARGDAPLPPFPVNVEEEEEDEEDEFNQKPPPEPLQWGWLNETVDDWVCGDPFLLQVRASKRAGLWSAGPEADGEDVPRNILLLKESERRMTAAIRIHCYIKAHREEVGLYAYKDPLNWTKVTLCGAREEGKVNVLLAQRLEGKPFLKGRVELSARHGWGKGLDNPEDRSWTIPEGRPPHLTEVQEESSLQYHYPGQKQLPVSLRLAVDEKGTATAHYSVSAGAWQPVVRGSGWMEESELFGQRERDYLHFGNPKQGQVAEARAPTGDWVFALIANSFGDGVDQWVSYEQI